MAPLLEPVCRRRQRLFVLVPLRGIGSPADFRRDVPCDLLGLRPTGSRTGATRFRAPVSRATNRASRAGGWRGVGGRCASSYVREGGWRWPVAESSSASATVKANVETISPATDQRTRSTDQRARPTIKPTARHARRRRALDGNAEHGEDEEKQPDRPQDQRGESQAGRCCRNGMRACHGYQCPYMVGDQFAGEVVAERQAHQHDQKPEDRDGDDHDASATYSAKRA